jgi:BirA family transcriptional regulator, biotin operon repressor / biotin---[acetyl-CoA-carboxylase] ligase
MDKAVATPPRGASPLHTLEPMTESATQTMMRALNRSAEDIWVRLHQQWPDLSIDVLPEVGSTNSALMDVARLGQLGSPRVMLTAEQTHGRGRLGKQWQTRVGDAITLSIALPWPHPRPLAGLSLATGVAVVHGLLATPDIDAQAFTPRIKWPNDIWVSDHKLAGILVEVCGQGEQRCVVIGVGINLVPPEGDHARSHNGVAPTGLNAYMPDRLKPQASAVATACVVHVAAMLQRFETSGFAAFQSDFDVLDALRGRLLHLSDGNRGTGAGVDSQGGLQLHSESGALQIIISQEVSVRPCLPS